VWLILKYRQRIKCICVGKEEPAKRCDEWQRGKRRVSNLTKVMKEEMESISPPPHLCGRINRSIISEEKK